MAFLVLFAYILANYAPLKVYVVENPLCPPCEEGLNAVLPKIQPYIQDAKVFRLSFKEAKDILSAAGIPYAPAVILEGNVPPALQRVVQRAGKYYVLVPAWPVVRVDPEGNTTKVVIQAKKEFAYLVYLNLAQRVPNLSLQLEEPDENHVVLVSVPADEENAFSWFFKQAERMKVGDRVIYSVPRVQRLAVDAFVSSLSPLSARVEGALLRLKEEFGNHIIVFPHFYYTDYTEGVRGPAYCIDAQSLVCSKGGAREAFENVREKCIFLLYGDDAYLRFANAVDKGRDWLEISKELNIDVNAVNDCISSQGISLALQDKALYKSLGIRIVPTVFFGAWYPVEGVADVNTYREVACAMLLGCRQSP